MNSPVVLDLHYTEPELVALYDQQNPRGEDYDFFIRKAQILNAKTVVDIGCGTGQLACEFAGLGFSVTGLDPAQAMLAYAKQQPGAAKVHWLSGDAGALGANTFDFAVMTGNVAQVFLTDIQWQQTLTSINRALRSGGHVAFESRNPDAQAWQGWVPEKTRKSYQSSQGEVESWLQLQSVGDGTVRFAQHCRLIDSGKYYVVNSELRFRSRGEIIDSLEQSGFQVRQVYGNWQSDPFNGQSRVMIFVAQKIASI